MEIDPDDPKDCAFYLGTYEPALISVIRRFVRKHDICVDVGAHKGYVTLNLARAVGEQGRVLSFEPDPRAREFLLRHCARNQCPNVSVYDCALGATNGSCSLKLTSVLGWSSLFPNDIAKNAVISEVTVPLCTFDELVTNGRIDLNLEKLSFVKIDVEGAELYVLSGMQQTLMATSPLLWVEINKGSLKTAGTSPREIESFLRSMGYSIYHPEHQRRLSGVQLTFNTASYIQHELSECENIAAIKNSSSYVTRLIVAGVLPLEKK